MTTDEAKELKSIYKTDLPKFALDVKVTKDNLKMFIDVIPHQNPVVERNELLSVLQNQFPGVDFDKSVIDEVCKLMTTGKPINRRRVARGSEPQASIDGKLLVLVKSYSGTGTPGVDSSGKFSLSSLNLFDNIKLDQVVARLYPPKSGKDGVDVLGKPIKSSTGNAIKVSLDKSLQLLSGSGENNEEQKFDRIIAKSEGLLIHNNNELSIKEELEIKGDVDFHCGNIDFYGKVIIQGDVQPGFTVSGRKGILVKGNLQKGSLRTTEGDIEIKGFAIGSKDSYIHCGGNLMANIIHEVQAEVTGGIIINKEALDCNLRSYKYVSIPNGRLVGGHIYVIHGVEAKEIGNDVGHLTKIEFSSAAEVSQEYASLIANIASHKKTIQLLELHIGPYVVQSSRIQLLKSPFREKMQQLLSKLGSVKDSLKKLEESKDKILTTAHIDPMCRVNAKSKLFQGVTLIAREDRFEFKDYIAGPISVVYDSANKTFITEPLKDITSPDDDSKKKENKNGKK